MNHRSVIKSLVSIALLQTIITGGVAAQSSSNTEQQKSDLSRVRHAYETVDGLKIFYREAGDPAKPTIVLLHGFPSSSHMYRNLMRDLSDVYHLVAPDYPGFGESSFPSRDRYKYTFDNIAHDGQIP